MPPPSPKADRPVPAITLRLTAAGLFAVMAALIKLASDAGVPIVHLMFWRFGFGLIPLLIYVQVRSSFGALRTSRPRAHLVRGAIGLASMWTSFEAVRRLPLAEATTISFAAPLLAIALSTVFLGERVGWRRWSAVALGLVGVAVVMQPGGEHLDDLGLLFAFGGGRAWRPSRSPFASSARRNGQRRSCGGSPPARWPRCSRCCSRRALPLAGPPGA